jgi:hypothetical protein
VVKFLTSLTGTNHLENLALGLPQPAGVAEVQVEDSVDIRVGAGGGGLVPHIVVVKKEGVVTLLEEDVLVEETLFEESILFLQIHQYLSLLR